MGRRDGAREKTQEEEDCAKGESGDRKSPGGAGGGDGAEIKSKQRAKEQEIDRGPGKRMKKTGSGGQTERETDRMGERANNYRPPSVFKAPLLSYPSCD